MTKIYLHIIVLRAHRYVMGHALVQFSRSDFTQTPSGTLQWWWHLTFWTKSASGPAELFWFRGTWFRPIQTGKTAGFALKQCNGNTRMRIDEIYPPAISDSESTANKSMWHQVLLVDELAWFIDMISSVFCSTWRRFSGRNSSQWTLDCWHCADKSISMTQSNLYSAYSRIVS